MQSNSFTVHVSGMTCSSCAARVEKALRAVPGVAHPQVNLAMDTATFSVSSADAVRAAYAALANAGYSVAKDDAPPPQTFAIGGMSCVSCAGRVEKALLAVPGVLRADVSPTLGEARVEMIAPQAETGTTQPPETLWEALAQAVEGAGYQFHIPHSSDSALKTNAIGSAARPDATNAARPKTHAPGRTPAIWWSEGAQVFIAAVLTFPLLLPMLAAPLGLSSALSPTSQLLLAGVLQTVFAWRFYRAAYFAVRSGAGNMDVLVSLGTTAAFLYSVYEGFFRSHPPGAEPHLYFESSAVIITLVRMGKWLEGRARARAVSALKELRSLQPDWIRIADQEQIKEIPASELRPGDLMVVAAGDRIGADGEIVAGSSSVNEALVTGESLPRSVQVGDQVLGGAVNGSGVLHVRATAPVAASTIARIAALVERAQAEKPPVQKKVDAVSAIFVPVVVTIALCTGAGWWLAGAGAEDSLLNAIAVLVIACPCALGLATPTAILVATSHAARMGLLIRDALALEQLRGVSTVVFDKTGTLTEGQPQVVDWVAVSGALDMGIALAAGLQQNSKHPLAAAVVRHAAQTGVSPIPPQGVVEQAGGGVRGSFLNGKVAAAMGTQTFLEEALPGSVRQNAWPDAAGWLDRGQTLAYFEADHSQTKAPAEGADGHTWNGPVRALVAFADRPRDTAREAVAELKRAGLTVWLLSGDAERAVKAVAQDLGVDHMASGVRPDAKDTFILQLQKKGAKVAMVGDGINDAPALARADVGVAMGSGTTVAIEAAALTLMRPDPRLISTAIDLSRRTVAKIHQNLFWAFVYNVVGIPLAAAGYLSPMLAGAAMALSSVCVVTNTLLLRRQTLT
jgi:Cu+-exporting ATPase